MLTGRVADPAGPTLSHIADGRASTASPKGEFAMANVAHRTVSSLAWTAGRSGAASASA
ncbi:hypothetical protein SCE1572_04900 [Sorangium cellulosum So0157-2]|uniref:Uncharacterized protein n=1 Tax=Sorangium cellulosum So0157-2 TaxID=1254432 RepID=S4XPX5_SORCE|nr:hypothetical protein SCE1572_04900 [Sorangium cellulosum So0157-2]